MCYRICQRRHASELLAYSLDLVLKCRSRGSQSTSITLTTTSSKQSSTNFFTLTQNLNRNHSAHKTSFPIHIQSSKLISLASSHLIMWTLVNKVVFGLFLASHVASLPYIEHLEGHQGYHKNASGHSILDRKLVNTKGGHVIPPTAVSTTGLTATPTTTTDNNEHATSSDIAARSQDEPPTIAVMRIFLRVNNPNWDGNNCVFWDDATFTNEDEIENICKNSLSNRLPGHWFKWLYYEKPTTAFPQGRHMAHVWGRPGFPTNHFPADESLRDNDPQVMQRMMQALAEVSARRMIMTSNR